MNCKLKVGQTVFYARNKNRGTDTGFATITKVGTKYFELDEFAHERFFIQTMSQDAGGYSPAIQIFLSEEDYLNLVRATKLKSKFREVFSWNSTVSLPLEQLEAINLIIESNSTHDQKTH